MKAAGLEDEARRISSDSRRRAYLDLADHWRRLADRYEDQARVWGVSYSRADRRH